MHEGCTVMHLDSKFHKKLYCEKNNFPHAKNAWKTLVFEHMYKKKVNKTTPCILFCGPLCQKTSLIKNKRFYIAYLSIGSTSPPMHILFSFIYTSRSVIEYLSQIKFWSKFFCIQINR